MATNRPVTLPPFEKAIGPEVLETLSRQIGLNDRSYRSGSAILYLLSLIFISVFSY
jgi:hypothetical protein